VKGGRKGERGKCHIGDDLKDGEKAKYYLPILIRGTRRQKLTFPGGKEEKKGRGQPPRAQ